MGWLTGIDRHSEGGPTEYFKGQFTDGYELLDSALVNLTTWYGAVKDPNGNVYAMVCPVHFDRDDTWGYKDQDEFMGPCDAKCPERILNMLSPLDAWKGRGVEYAQQWRDACREYHERRKLRRQLKDGATVKLLSTGYRYPAGTLFTVTYHLSRGRRRQCFVDEFGRECRFGPDAQFELVDLASEQSISRDHRNVPHWVEIGGAPL